MLVSNVGSMCPRVNHPSFGSHCTGNREYNREYKINEKLKLFIFIFKIKLSYSYSLKLDKIKN